MNDPIIPIPIIRSAFARLCRLFGRPRLRVAVREELMAKIHEAPPPLKSAYYDPKQFRRKG